MSLSQKDKLKVLVMNGQEWIIGTLVLVEYFHMQESRPMGFR